MDNQVSASSLSRYTYLENRADVMLRGYTVRSKAPLVGWLIAWIRRTLTSHLRAPYIDPMFERQVAFNRAVLHELRKLGATQEEILERLERLETQISAEQDIEEES